MLIRELIQDIAAGWPAYHAKQRVDANETVYDLVERRFPEVLKPHIVEYDNLKAKGSTGRGIITAAPWIAIFDQRITTKATAGYYIVYLFSTDMLSVTLSLAFGTTQFEQQFGGPVESFPRMRFAATRLQEMFNHIIPAHLIRHPIDLAAEPRQELHYAYQQSAILSHSPYLISTLPQEEKLIADVREMARLYTEIASDPLDVTVDRLVEAAIEPARRVDRIEVRDFQFRPPAKRKGAVGTNNRRYSPESRKVGTAGEKIVVQYEQERLRRIGRQDLFERVRWHTPEQEFPGWDITSVDEGGNEFFIEVKSCVGKSVTVLNLTANEWKAARHSQRRDRYYIYIVTSALSDAPRIERLRNPASYVDDKLMSCEPLVYELRLVAEQKDESAAACAAP